MAIAPLVPIIGPNPVHSPANFDSGPSAELVNQNPSSVDLDTPDELAIRALLLGINHRIRTAYGLARGFLTEAQGYQVSISTWVAGVALFEMAVLDLLETETKTKGIVGDERKRTWTDTLKGTNQKLDHALNVSGSSVDFSSRLESRISMLRDEIAAKAVMEGIVL